MRLKFYGYLVMICILCSWCRSAHALDEGALTPTQGKAVAAEEQEFEAAMDVWFGHKYTDGEKLLRQFSKKHPDSRWAAEAEVQVSSISSASRQS